MTKFDPLGTMRAIRDDQSLTTAQVALLMCAVLRTDNNTCHVRCSIEVLAADAKVSYKTARTAFKDEAVLKYFSKVEKTRRKADFWFYDSPRSTLLPPQVVTVTSSGGNGYHPSTSVLPTSTSTSDSASASSPNHKSEWLEEDGYEDTSSSPNLQTTPNPKNALNLMTTEEPEEVMVTSSEYDRRTAADWREIRKQRPLTKEETNYINASSLAYMEKHRAKRPVLVGDEW